MPYIKNKKGVMVLDFEDETPETKLYLGQRVFFEGERNSYEVKAVSPKGRYAICTKPFNARKTVLYCIIDFKYNKRSPDDYIFGIHDYATKKGIKDSMKGLLKGETKLSIRREADLKIVKIVTPRNLSQQKQTT